MNDESESLVWWEMIAVLGDDKWVVASRALHSHNVSSDDDDDDYSDDDDDYVDEYCDDVYGDDDGDDT